MTLFTDTDTLHTLGDWLTAIESVFSAHPLYYGHGTDSAWDEAVALVRHVMQLPPDVTDACLPTVVSTAQSERLIALATARVEQRIPLPYLTHEAWFMELPFYVDERVLIPRSPFAELIQRGFDPWCDPAGVKRVLEIGTGSGCMSIAAAHVMPWAQCVATDIDPAALAVARRNVEAHQLSDRVELVESDIFSAVAGRFDIIMSNPPYVGAEEMASLPAEYRHEPVSALETAEDGLAIVLLMLKQAHRYLTESGVLVVEVGNSWELLQQRCPQLPFTWLEFESGGHGVFVLHRADLAKEEESL